VSSELISILGSINLDGNGIHLSSDRTWKLSYFNSTGHITNVLHVKWNKKISEFSYNKTILKEITLLMSAFSWPIVDTIPHSVVYSELKRTGMFEDMSRSIDEAEHSMEMHLPYLAKVFKG
jgi:hypothetical protein